MNEIFDATSKLNGAILRKAEFEKDYKKVYFKVFEKILEMEFVESGEFGFLIIFGDLGG